MNHQNFTPEQQHQQQQPLPPYWEARFDPGQQRYYFINHFTHQTQWVDPRLPQQGETSAYSRQNSLEPTEATERQEEHGRQQALAEEAARKKQEEHKRQQALEKEAARKKQEEHKRQQALEKEAARKKQEQLDRKQALAKEAAKKKQEEHELKQALEKEAARKIQEEHELIEKEAARKIQEEHELKQALEKEAARKRQEEHELKQALEKEAAKKRKKEQEEQQALAVQQQRANAWQAAKTALAAEKKQSQIDSLAMAQRRQQEYSEKKQTQINAQAIAQPRQQEHQARETQQQQSRQQALARAGKTPIVEHERPLIQAVWKDEPQPIVEQHAQSAQHNNRLFGAKETKESPIDSPSLRQKEVVKEANTKPAITKIQPCTKDLVPVERPRVQHHTDEYVSKLRCKAVGPDPKNRIGPNPDLRLRSHTTAVGPDPRNYRGPQASSYHGRDPSNYHGPDPSNYHGPDPNNYHGTSDLAVGPMKN